MKTWKYLAGVLAMAMILTVAVAGALTAYAEDGDASVSSAASSESEPETSSGAPEADPQEGTSSEPPVSSEPAHTHQYDTTVTEPTCTAWGYTTYTCSCGHSYTDNRTTPKGHAIAGWTTVAEPTCTEPGSKTVTCSRCDYSETREIPANGHSYKAKVSAATCTEGGYTSHTCSVCNHNYADNKTEALGHDITSWTTVTPPTCTEPGSQTGTCSRCDHSETKEIPAKGHSETSVVTPPTCTAEGYTTYTCTVCGAVRTDNKTAALGHKIDSWTTTKEPGCATEGSQTGTCIRCDYSETKPIPAKGHSETSVVTPPTCTTEGYTTYTCTVCGAVRTDNKTAALGHKIDSWTTTKEPGCATEGSQTGTCTRCDYSETKPIPAKGHSYTSVVTKPTCTEEGYTTHTCACGDSYTDGETPALGHDFGEWKVTQKPTYTATGTERRTCTRCSHYEERSIPKKPLPDAFSVKADNKDVTSSFKKNEHIVTGTVVYTVTKLTVSITEYGVNNTITFNFNDADGVKVSNGIRYTFTLPLVHDVDGRPITDYYTIRVVQVPAPVSSRPASSSKPSSAPESEMPPSSESPSSSVMPSEPEEPSSSEVPSVPEKPSSSKAPVTSQDNTAGRMDWMLPAAILMGVLCAAGILYVIGQLLVSYGLLGKKQPDDTDDADNMIDLFKQDPVDTDSELDEIFHNKK